MKISGIPHSAAALKSALNPRTDSDLKPDPRPRRRRPRTPGSGRVRLAGVQAGRRSRPETPLLKWKVNDREERERVENEAADVAAEPARRDRRRKEPSVSARKLAAGIWRLQMPEEVPAGGKRREKLGFEQRNGCNGIPIHQSWSTKVYASEAKEYLPSPSSSLRNGYQCKLQPSLQLSNSAMEGITKWDPVCLKTSHEARHIYRQMKLLDQQVSAVSVVAALEGELEQSRARIHELESERRSSKKKLEHFLNKISEDKAMWRSREHEKVRMFIDDLKSELNRERKARQRVEIVNSKLVNELADAKLSAKRYAQDYEKERKARELIEEVCDELAKEIGEDKAEVEALKRESARMRDEVDEERKMLQMAEVWREERVQMKLVDAKVALYERYAHMNTLVSELEKFMTSSESESLRRAAASINVQDVKEFSYEPPGTDDIFSVFEEMNYGEADERVHTVSPEINRSGGEVEEDESGWETVSHGEDQGSSFSPEGSDPSVNNGEVCSVPAKQTKKGSSITRLWRSCSNNGESYKIISVDGLNNEGAVSPERGSGKDGFSPEGQWSSPESGVRGKKGCIPRGGAKQSLKSKLLEARIESQKLQLRHVLRQKY